MKDCHYCGKPLARRPREAHWQYAARLFCSRQCADKGRRTTRLDDADFKARYRQIKVNGRRILEHRYVMEQAIGRPLRRDEQVHHINHNRLDNRIENLELVTIREHAARHTWRPLTSTCEICGATFTPHKTKRGIKRTCSKPCGYALVWKQRRERGTDRWANRPK